MSGKEMAALFPSLFSCQVYDVTMISAYAPHSGYQTEDKEIFYEQLSEEITDDISLVATLTPESITYEKLTLMFVDHIIGRGMEYLNNMNEQTKENRALFLGWCKRHHLKVLNNQFSKPQEKLIT